MFRPTVRSISARVFGSAVVGVVAALVSPLPDMDRALLLYVSVLTLFLCVLTQVFCPLILVLRPCKNTSIDNYLLGELLPFMNRMGRPCWLHNQDSVFDRRFQRILPYSPDALVGQIVTTAFFACVLFFHIDFLVLVPALLVVIVGSTWLLDMSVGNAGDKALALLLTALTCGPFDPSLNWPGSSVAAIRCTICFALVILVLTALRWFRSLFFSSTIRHRLDLIWLMFEMWLPLCFMTRYLHGGPSTITSIACSIHLWQAAVKLLLVRTRFVFMDVSDLELGSGLAWELEECFSSRIKMLLMFPDAKKDLIVLRVRQILPKAVLLPDDFQDIARVADSKREDVIIAYCYKEQPSMLVLKDRIDVLLGKKSMSKWLQEFNVRRSNSAAVIQAEGASQ